jgi:flagellar protein FliS
MLASYHSVATHSGVAAADPHRLIVMLMDGALERIAQARGCIDRRSTAEKARLLHRAVAIVDELRNSLDHSQGGQIAENLDRLYEYMCSKLMSASVDNSLDALDEVSTLLHDVRSAWLALPMSARALRQGHPA